MKYLIITFLIVLGVTFNACNTKQHAENTQLTLNNGAKWQVDANMKIYLTKSMEIFEKYQLNKETNYQKLAADIEEQNQLLTKNCTMQGKAHDALHTWLVPHLELVGKLKTTQAQDESISIINKIALSFGTFNKYFE